MAALQSAGGIEEVNWQHWTRLQETTLNKCC